ncbi:hypothetical protein [Micromonospora sp. NPDC051006]
MEIAVPLIPPAPVRRQGGGRRRVDDRALLAAIVYADPVVARVAG